MAGRPLRSDAQRLTENELLAKLQSFGLDLDRPSLERLSKQALSAEEIGKPLLDQHTFKSQREERERDWIWICLVTLWQRWFPDEPSFEGLDDKMQAGYELLASRGATAACRPWLDAWAEVLRLLDKGGLQSISEFDERFRGSQSLFNWIQDLEQELWNAGLEEQPFLTARIALCEEALRRFGSDDELMTENWRRALAALEPFHQFHQPLGASLLRAPSRLPFRHPAPRLTTILLKRKGMRSPIQKP